MKIIKVFFLSLAITLLCLPTCASAASAGAGEEPFHLFVPGVSWVLDAGPFPGFGVIRTDFNRAMTGRMLIMKNREKDITLSIFIDEAPLKGDAKACRDYFLGKEKQGRTIKEELKFSEQGNMALVEYIVKGAGSPPAVRKSIDAFIARDDYWIDIHLIKPNYSAADYELLMSLLGTVRFAEDYKPSMFDDYLTADAFYARENYHRAIKYYEKLPFTDEKAGGLNKGMRRSIIYSLGTSYRKTGNIAGSIDIFEKGIAGDAGYPLFYYGLAADYAVRNDLEKTMTNLHRSFVYRQNLGTDAKMPNPASDPVFEKFMANENFAAFLKVLQSQAGNNAGPEGSEGAE